jgi:hypothetical protein
VFCEKLLVVETLEADRIEAGGSYRHENIQPTCGGCNKRRGTHSVAVFAAMIAIG